MRRIFSLVAAVAVFVANPAYAKVRYVQLGCPDGAQTYDPARKSCTGGTATVYGSIAKGVNGIAAGDTLSIRGNTYAEHVTVPSSKSGTSSLPTTITGYPGEQVVIKPSATNGAGSILWVYGHDMVLDNVIIDGANLPTSASNLVGFGESTSETHHLTLSHSEVRNLKGQGSACISYYGSNNHDFLYSHLRVHHCGTQVTNPNPGAHCIYVGGRNVIIEHSEISDCYTMAVQLYPSPADTIIRSSHMWNTGSTAIVSYDRSAQIDDNEIDHFGTNTVYGSSNAGIRVTLGGQMSYARRNTIASGQIGIWLEPPGGVTVEENAITQTPTPILNEGTDNIFSGNTCEPVGEYCSAPPITEVPPPSEGTIPAGTYECSNGEHSFTLTLTGEVAAKARKK